MTLHQSLLSIRNSVKNIAENFFVPPFTARHTILQRSRLKAANYVWLIFCLYFVFVGIKFFLNRIFPGAVCFIGSAILLPLNYLLFRIRRKTIFFCYCLTFIIGAMLLISLFLGGFQGIGLFWPLSFPILALIINGSRRGLRFSMIFVIFHGIALFLLYQYPLIFSYYSFKSSLGEMIIPLIIIEVTTFLIFWAEVHSREIAERKAIDFHEQKNRFFINFAHETRTPLTIILNAVDQVSKEHPGDRNLDLIQKQLYRLKEDMLGFLDYEKMNRGMSFFNHTRPFALSLLLKEIQETLNLAGLGHRFIFSVKEDLFIKIDSSGINRIMNNLIENALKYSPDDSVIDISLGIHHQKVRLSIYNRGESYSAEEINRFFDPFYRKSTLSGSNSGMGMGLNMVKQIIEDAGGRISLESPRQGGIRIQIDFSFSKSLDINSSDSQDEDSGSRLSVAGLQPELSVSEKIPSSSFDGSSSSLKTILLIEDNQQLRTFLTERLGEEFHVLSEKNCDAAMGRIGTVPVPDLILCDIMMEGMDGITFFNRIQETVYRGIPVIFLSARQDREDILNTSGRGAVEFLQKPFRYDHLAAKIRTLLAFSEKHRDAAKREMEQKILGVLSQSVRDDTRQNRIREYARQHHLTEREKDILFRLAEGRSTKEISETFYISIHTLKKHLSNIYRKCDVGNKKELLSRFE